MLIQAIENQIFRHMAPQAIRHLQKPKLRTPDPRVQQVLKQALKEFQIAPPLTIHMGDPDLLAGIWHLTREAYVVNVKGRARREAVAAAISKLNECPYCETVHAGMFEGAGNNADHLDDPSQLPVPIRSAYAFAAATLSPGSDALENHNIERSERTQIFATAFAYHYINRMVSVFLGKTPVALPGMASARGQKLARASFSFFGKRLVELNPQPGQCVIQTQYPLPAEFSWASTDSHISGALAHFAHVAESAGRGAVPLQVRKIVLANLDKWQGENPPMSRSWLEEAVAPLDDSDKPSARLCLLSARSAYQVDDTIILAFREITPDDRALLQTVSWASFAAARRIAGWLAT